MKKLALVLLLLASILLVTAWAQTQPASLTETQRITHLLNRIGFGSRPGDVERVRQIGIDKYIDQQLHPETISDATTVGPPRSRPRNTDRRDHNICPSDRSNTRKAEAPTVGVPCCGAAIISPGTETLPAGCRPAT